MDNQPWRGLASREDAGADVHWLEQHAVLELLLPEALTPDMTLEERDMAELQHIIGEALEAFKLSYPECRLRISALLGELQRPISDPGLVDVSGLPLTVLHANDYDRYFRVNRVTSGQPAHVLLRSFLQIALSVTDLLCRAPDLPKQAPKVQFEGFEAHARLLARCFGAECAS